MNIESLVVALVAAPLISAVCGFFATNARWRLSAGFCATATLTVAFLSVLIAQNTSLSTVGASVPWFTLGKLSVDLGFLLTPLSSAMIFVVGVVGLAVVLFSLRYVREDVAQSRYWSGISLFLFAMLGLALSDNLLVLFVFWELVGFGSYLLIGHNSTPEAGHAANKAMMVNRIADVFFLLGIVMVLMKCGTLDIAALAQYFSDLPLGEKLSVAAPFFFAVMAKSAQIPLSLWLPEAMEGPTPISALIHAATMVASGVYLLCRVDFIFEVILPVIAWVGTITAFVAALCAFGQNSLKRVLAYSTISQLGFMVAGFGMGSPSAAFFHLTTHAFFKALLFLGAGAVLTATHHEQTLYKLGGLWKRMPWTFSFFTIGALSLSGFPLTAGFFSKDTIFLVAQSRGDVIFYILLLTSLLTALYMGRLIGLAFFGAPRSDAAAHAKDEGPIYQAPLALLALGAIFGGAVVCYPGFMAQTFARLPIGGGDVLWELWGVVIVALGLAVAWVYAKSPQEPLKKLLGVVYDDLNAGIYLKKMWDTVGGFFTYQVGRALYSFDEGFIGGVVTRGVGAGVGVVGLLVQASYQRILTASLYWILVGALILIMLFSR